MSRAAALRIYLLAVLLVVAQLGLAAHALSHLGGDEKQGAAHPACEWCTAYSHLGAAAPAPLAPQWTALREVDAPSRGKAIAVPLAPAAAYRVRAPPVLS